MKNSPAGGRTEYTSGYIDGICSVLDKVEKIMQSHAQTIASASACDGFDIVNMEVIKIEECKVILRAIMQYVRWVRTMKEIDDARVRERIQRWAHLCDTAD